MLFLYSIPNFCMAVIVVGVTVAAALLGDFIARRLKFPQLDAEQRAITLTMASVVTTIDSLLAAYGSVIAGDAHDGTERTMAAEAARTQALQETLAPWPRLPFHTPDSGDPPS